MVLLDFTDSVNSFFVGAFELINLIVIIVLFILIFVMQYYIIKFYGKLFKYVIAETIYLYSLFKQYRTITEIVRHYKEHRNNSAPKNQSPPYSARSLD